MDQSAQESYVTISIGKKVTIVSIIVILFNLMSLMYLVSKYITTEDIFRDRIASEFSDIKTGISELPTLREVKMLEERIDRLERRVDLRAEDLRGKKK